MPDPLFAQNIWWKQRTGDDGYGQAVLAAAVQSKGRWLAKIRVLHGKDGRTLQSDATVMLPIDHAVTAGDQLSADGEAYVEVLAVERGVSLGGNITTVRAFC